MRFQVPQFIEVEDKIFGPLTLKQFIYIAGGAGLSFLVYVLVDSVIIATVPIIVIMSISCSLAFFKINNRPLINAVEAAFKYYLAGKLYIWRKEEKEAKSKKQNSPAEDAKKYASIMVPKISDSKLKDLTWSLDIKESIYSDRKLK
jgi:hypothetical protein